ncbi:MAG TPA: heme exporter protein CcmB [Limnochordales bacterium]
MTFWSRTYAIFWKDLRAELRSRETAGTTVVFALLAVLTFSFAFDPAAGQARMVVPGVLWVTVFFAGMLGLGRSMATERAADAFSGLLASPAEPEEVYAGKFLANLLFTGVVELVEVPVLMALFRGSVAGPVLWLVAVLALGTVGYVAIGTLLAAVATSARASELLLPLLLLPVAIPVAIGAVEATAALMAGGSPEEWMLWVRLLAVYDVVMLALPQLLFRYLLEA